MPANTSGALTTKVSTGSPYQLEPTQVTKAATALLAHIKSHAAKRKETAGKKNLLEDADAEEETEEQFVPVWLTVGTKKHIKDQARLKPAKVQLPHPIQKSDCRICLITVDPQRAYKNLKEDPLFPAHIASKIHRVIGFKKLKTKYKAYEARRQLFAEYDLFLADDRVISGLPAVLGKTFYGNNQKRPLPVDLTAGAPKPKAAGPKKVNPKKEEKELVIGTAKAVGNEIEKALKATLVNMTSSANTAIKVGNTAMTEKEISENVEAVVTKLADKFVPKGWRGIRSLHIKGPNTQALPIWLADELWADDADVREEKWKPPVKDAAAPRMNEKKRKWEEWEEELLDEEQLATRERKAKKALKGPEEKKNISNRNSKKALKKKALESVQPPLVAS